VNEKGACLASQKNWIAARAYLDAVYSTGYQDPLGLRWLCISLLMLGDIERAVGILNDWKRLEPANPEIGKIAAAIENSLQSFEESTSSPQPTKGVSSPLDAD
jgi:hypothetical protein